MPIAEAVSDALETPIEELPLLSDAIDPDGLDTLMSNSRCDDITVTFSYAGLRVLVHSEDTVYVRPFHSDDNDQLNPAYFDRYQGHTVSEWDI